MKNIKNKLKNLAMGIGFGLVGFLPSNANAQSVDNAKVASDFIEYVDNNKDTTVTKRNIEYARMGAKFGGVIYPQYASKENSIIAAYDFGNLIYADGSDGGVDGNDSVEIADGVVDAVYKYNNRKGLRKLDPAFQQMEKHQKNYIKLMEYEMRKGKVPGYERQKIIGRRNK